MNDDIDVMLPCTFVIFGATGNLSTNKLLPALYHLEAAARLSESLSIIAFARREWSDDDWRKHMREVLADKIKGKQDTPVFERFIARFAYQQGDLNDVKSYQALAKRLPNEEACSSTVFYLAIKPAEFAAVVHNLEAVGLNRPRGLNRVVV
ncbi:MAG: glucose-6-phosphate dehydrogenase, partial [Gammaproteobacteria bacterium]